MKRREKVGVLILIGLFVLFGVILVWTLRGRYQADRDMSQGFFVQTHIELRQKGK